MTDRREAIFITTLIAFTAMVLSLGAALVFNLGPDPPVGQVTGAAWAWAIGAASERWWFPWVKGAVPRVEDGDAE